MKNFLAPGRSLYVASAAGSVTAGKVAIVGAHVGVAVNSAAIGEPYEVALDGVYQLPKSAGAAWTQGQPLMWDASAAAFAAVGTPATGDVTSGGFTAFADAGSAAVTGQVRLSGIPGTVAA